MLHVSSNYRRMLIVLYVKSRPTTIDLVCIVSHLCCLKCFVTFTLEFLDNHESNCPYFSSLNNGSFCPDTAAAALALKDSLYQLRPTISIELQATVSPTSELHKNGDFLYPTSPTFTATFCLYQHKKNFLSHPYDVFIIKLLNTRKKWLPVSALPVSSSFFC